MKNDSVRLEKIKADRIELLKRVKESISNNNNILDEEINTLNDIIALDNECMERLDSIEKAKELCLGVIPGAFWIHYE